MPWYEVFYPNGMKVVALNDVGMWQEGEITTHTADMQSRTIGIIVRFDDGGWCEYELSYLDESGNYDNSFVRKAPELERKRA